MACFHISTLFALLFTLILLTQNIAECRVTQETLNTAEGTSKGPKLSEEGTKWAVLVAGSSGYGNYRHQVINCLLRIIVFIKTLFRITFNCMLLLLSFISVKQA